MCPWPRAFLFLALASDFFCVLGLGLEPCVLDSTSSERAKIFGLVYFSPNSLLITKKKSSRQIAPFTVSPSFRWVSKKKKVISPNCSIYLLVFCGFPKKSYRLEIAARERGVWVGILGGQKFCLGSAAPFCSPVVAALLIQICPEHDICGRNRISTVLQCLTILLSHAKCFVSILLQSVVLNLLYSRICLASELNLSNQ